MSTQSRLFFATTIALLSGLIFSILGSLPSLGWRVTLQDILSHQTATQLFRNSYYQRGPSEYGIVIHDNHYLGKAFILSIDGILPSDIVFAAKQCGFYPFPLDALQPNADRYPDYSAFLDFCFGGQHVASARNMGAGEVALVGSHRLALHRIAEDPDLRDDDWSIILESDARLHPDAVRQARSLVGSAIERQKNTSGYGFMYLGACNPTCENVDGFIGQNCTGHCTHALALTKQRAKTFFRELYCRKDGVEAPCGWACRENDCMIDQVMKRFFLEPGSPSIPVVGYDFKSPNEPTHRGLLYQCCRTEATKVLGTSLHGIGFSPMPSLSSHGPRCFRTKFTGRLGNLMFQYAALVGACIKIELQPETCAGFSLRDLNRHEIMMPTKLLHDVFAIPVMSCPRNASLTYREHADSIYTIKYDARVLKQPAGTTFQGYLQSYKYFRHAQNDIRRLYRFSNDVTWQTRRYFADIRLQSQRVLRQDDPEIACISIRRGDKTRTKESTFYDHRSLSTEYYQKAWTFFGKRTIA